MALTHTQTTERVELIALSVGEVQMDSDLLSNMIWSQLGSDAYLPVLTAAPEISLDLRLLVHGGIATIREYTEDDLDETCVLSHIQIRPHKQHLSWRPIVTLVQRLDEHSTTAVGEPGDWRHEPCTPRGVYTSTLEGFLLTDTRLKELGEALLAELRVNALESLETEVF